MSETTTTPNAASALPAHLLAHLDRIATSQGFTTHTIVPETGTNAGDGFMATMYAVTIVGERQPAADGTARAARLPLICKLKPANAARQEQMQSDMVFEREVTMYTTVLPAIERFQTERGLRPADGLSAYPRCYAAQNKADADGGALIIMDDLRAAGFRMWGKAEPLPVGNARQVVEQLALLHGVSVAVREQQPELFAEWQAMPDIFERMAEQKAVQAIFESSLLRALKVVSDERHRRVLEAFRKDWAPLNVRCMDRKVLGAHAVLSHGDCWNNNMMYRAEGGEDGKKTGICMLDWQLSRVTSPAVDLAYFLFSSTEKQLRRDHWEELLGVYYAKFSEIIRRCGSNPWELYTLADLKRQLARHAVYGVLCAPILCSIMVADADSVVDADAQAEKLDAGEAGEHHLVLLNEKTEKLYARRVIDVLDDALAWGWLEEYRV